MHLICTLRNGIAGEPFRQGLVLGYAGFDETVIDTSIKTLAHALR
jgi:GntR family transcriptional regulator / MocR family aminotransferase